jgi:hypothetical protein
MSDDSPREPKRDLKHTVFRWSILVAGIVVGQLVLYGPSLVGHKVLLPLDILAVPTIYIPSSPETAGIQPKSRSFIDLALVLEPARRFAAAEIGTGRLPMWSPYQYAGAPFTWPKFSPFLALECCTVSPVVIAWAQMAVALVAGLGAYAFFRRALTVSFWPAAICSWCYPLTAFFVFWQGYFTALPVSWLPWLLLAVEGTVRRRHWAAPMGLAVVTGLVLTSGQLDMAGQALLVSGIFAVWRLGQIYGRQWFGAAARSAAVSLVIAWGLGLLLASPYILPVLEYTRTGARMARRGAGEEERPPVGLSALPQVVLPDMYGRVEKGTVRYAAETQMESSAAIYAGLLAALVAAPLAFCGHKERWTKAFWVLLTCLSLGWCLNVPGLVQLLRLPGLNMMSHNRLVFAGSFAILALSAIGLDALSRGLIQWRRWFWLPAVLVAGLGLWCLYRAVFLPAQIETELQTALSRMGHVEWIQDENGIRQTQAWFSWHFFAAAFLCALGLAAWWTLRVRPSLQKRFWPAFGLLMVGDLLFFGFGRSPQCDPDLYYPLVPALQQVAKAEPGRVIGCNCLPATVSSMAGLHDIRGYDAVDPGRFIDLIKFANDPASPKVPYAFTQWMIPKATFTPEGQLRLTPILDMLNVRYVIFRGTAPPEHTPAFQSPDYWVLTNAFALPRAFVPRQVEVVVDAEARLEKLASAEFDARQIAYTETTVELPPVCRGSTEIVSEEPNRIRLAARMETAGLVVLADLWDQGWRAWLDGKPAPILRVNHAIRGVVVPTGSSILEFRYQPRSFTWGIRCFAGAALVLIGWFAVALRRRSAPCSAGAS